MFLAWARMSGFQNRRPSYSFVWLLLCQPLSHIAADAFWLPKVFQPISFLQAQPVASFLCNICQPKICEEGLIESHSEYLRHRTTQSGTHLRPLNICDKLRNLGRLRLRRFQWGLEFYLVPALYTDIYLCHRRAAISVPLDSQHISSSDCWGCNQIHTRIESPLPLGRPLLYPRRRMKI